MLEVLFFGTLMKMMLEMRNYAKNYTSTIYKDLLTLYLFFLENILSDFKGSLRFLYLGWVWGRILQRMSGQFFLDYYVLPCNTDMFIQIGSQTWASLSFVLPAEVRISHRAAACAHFLVINKGVGQFYLSFDTRQLTIPIPFS